MAWLTRLLNVFRRDRVQRDIDRELQFHLAERADELQAAGMDSRAAQQVARVQFGNVSMQRERTGDMDVSARVESAARNLRLAARTLLKTPAFSATVVLTLAVGIGANSAVFSAIHAVLIRPLPFPDGDQLMELGQTGRKNPIALVAPPRLMDWRRMNSSFQAITGYYSHDISELSGEVPERLKQAVVGPGFLQVWGIAPAMGRDFRPEEERFGGPSVALISDRYWRTRMGADPNAVGKRLRIGGSGVTVVGVMPASFRFPEREVDLWSPNPMDAPYAQSRESTWFVVIGRLKPEFTVEQARADMEAVQANLGRLYPKTDAEIKVSVRPFKETVVGKSRQSLWLLFGSVSLLLLIACTNIAALLLSRTAERQREISVRFSLGASRTSVVLQLLSESFLLALIGASLGLMAASGAARIFRSLAADFPRLDEVGVDGTVLFYSLLCAVLTTLLCGLYPALRCTSKDLSGTLVQAGRSQVAGRNPAQFLLVSVQVALAVVLLVGAGLLVRSFRELGRVSPGFDVAGVHVFRMSSSWGETGDLKRLRQRTQAILDHLRTAPEIESTAMSISVPGVPTDYQEEVQVVEGRAETEPKIVAANRAVSAGYFATLRIPLISGEVCRDEGVAPGLVVNRSFSNTYLNGGGIGLHLKAMSGPGVGEVVGIVGDARESGMNRAPAPTVYWCYSAAQPGVYFLVKTRGEPKGMAELLRRKMREIEPRRSIYGIASLDGLIGDAFAENRLRTVLLAFFAVTAVLLACIGLYGTLSYMVSVRRREIGLRLALGALRPQIARQFLRQGIWVAALGCLAGLGLAAFAVRLIAGMLYGVAATDWVTVAGVVSLVAAVSVLASLLPAVRAARLDPMQVLREE